MTERMAEVRKPASGWLAAIVRRFWCEKEHAWRGYELTAAEQEMYRSPNMTTASWSRRTCRWCRNADIKTRVLSESDRDRLLTEVGATQAREVYGRDLRIGSVSRVVSPGYGWCYGCGTSWLFVRGHSTPYRDGSGCFPLCEACWAEMTPEERLPHYERLWAEWEREGCEPEEERWELIRDAVLAGL